MTGPRALRECAAFPRAEYAPSWPVGDLIFDLVECLFELKNFSSSCALASSAGQISVRASVSRYDSQNAPDRRAPQTANPGTERRALFGRYVGRPVDGGTRGIVDRAKESSDIARRRLLDPALVEALARLTLEVENVGVVLGDKDLAKMKIAVTRILLPVKCCSLRPSMCEQVASR